MQEHCCLHLSLLESTGHLKTAALRVCINSSHHRRDWADKPLLLFKSSLELAKLHHSLKISEIIEKKIKNKNLDDNSLAMAFSSL